jgi:hypothetical protein
VSQKLIELEYQRQQKLWMAQRWREYAQRNLEHTYASQVQQAQDEYDYERQELLDRTVGAAARAKGGRSQAQRANGGSLGVDGNGTGGSRMVTRTSSRRRTRQQASAEAMGGGVPSMDAAASGGGNAQLQAKLRKLNPPLISFALTDDEIVEDLSIICNRLSTFSPEMKRAMFQEALGYPPAPSLLPPPNNYHPPSGSSSPSSSSTSSTSAAPSTSSGLLPVFSPPASPPRTSAFAHKLISPQQQDPFAAPS